MSKLSTEEKRRIPLRRSIICCLKFRTTSSLLNACSSSYKRKASFPFLGNIDVEADFFSEDINVALFDFLSNRSVSAFKIASAPFRF